MSISLSAATSLDWKRQITHDNELAARLHEVASLKGEDVVLIRNRNGEESMRMRHVMIRPE